MIATMVVSDGEREFTAQTQFAHLPRQGDLITIEMPDYPEITARVTSVSHAVIVNGNMGGAHKIRVCVEVVHE